MKLGMQEFFLLPMEEKKRFSQEEGDVQGYGQVFVVKEDQKLDWGDMFYVVTLPKYLRKKRLIPEFPHKLRCPLLFSSNYCVRRTKTNSIYKCIQGCH